jgi:hypothetical protein
MSRSGLLSGSVHADSAPLLAKVRATYDLLADVAAGYGVPWPAAVATSPFGSPADDPVARRRLDQALRALRADDVDAALGHYAAAGRRAPGRCLTPLPVPGARVWVLTSRDDPWATDLVGDFAEVLGTPGQDYDVVPATPAHVEVLRRAVATLGDADPGLLGVLAHTSTVCVVDGPDAFESASDRLLPRSVYVSAAALSGDPARAAEALLHESVHQKLYDLQLVHGVYRNGYDERVAPVVRPPWHEGRASWSFDRALAACHVYTHLAYFYASLHAADPTRRTAADEHSARCSLERARELLDALVSLGDAELNRHGRDLVSWLATEIDRQVATTMTRSAP